LPIDFEFLGVVMAHATNVFFISMQWHQLNEGMKRVVSALHRLTKPERNCNCVLKVKLYFSFRFSVHSGLLEGQSVAMLFAASS
jgi:hypothetical protein